MAADIRNEQALSTWGSGTHPSDATRAGDAVLKTGGPWASAVLALLLHLERVGGGGSGQREPRQYGRCRHERLPGALGDHLEGTKRLLDDAPPRIAARSRRVRPSNTDRLTCRGW